MKVVNKWNRRLLRAVRRTGNSGSNKDVQDQGDDADDRSIGSNDDDVRITDGKTGLVTKTVERRTRESVMRGLPPPGQLSQHSVKHLDLLYALAYPKRETKGDVHGRSGSSRPAKVLDEGESKVEENGTPEVSTALTHGE